jgi:hypothetical protein
MTDPNPSSVAVNGDQSRQFQELQERLELLEKENARLRSMIPSDKKADEAEINVESVEEDPGLSADSLSPKQIERYSRQLLIRGGFGVEGQLKLLSSSVLIVGAGGIGSTGTTKF